MTSSRAWYQNTVIYGIDVRSFQDSSDDGVGDLGGVTSRLDYLAELGVGTLWLLPFYVSPYEDNGYDVVDHCRIDPLVGTDADFDELVRQAHDRGLRLIIELIGNHTSDQHPWFQQARSDARSPYRDYYVWTDEPPPLKEQPKPIIPEKSERGVWTRDDVAGQWYYHRFRPFEPDLRMSNASVRRELHAIMRHWLDRGVDGFRLDAVSHMVEAKGEHAPDDAGDMLRELRRVADESGRAVMLMGEADVDLDELAEFFAGGEGLNALLGFLLAEYSFLALARGSAEPLARLLAEMPPPPPGCTWAQFLRNLDELDMERLAPAERRTVYRHFAPHETMRIYGRGIRRRLAPMMDGDRRRLEMCWSLLFGMPGVPLLVYGDELGMGDDMDRYGREAVRLPMPWTGEPGIGFSAAPVSRFTRAPKVDGPYGAAGLNAAQQLDDPTSLLQWFGRLTRLRRGLAVIGSGRPRVLDVASKAVLAIGYEDERQSVVVLSNLSGRDVRVRLPVNAADARVLLGDGDEAPDGDGRLDLAGYGYRWLALEQA